MLVLVGQLYKEGKGLRYTAWLWLTNSPTRQVSFRKSPGESSTQQDLYNELLSAPGGDGATTRRVLRPVLLLEVTSEALGKCYAGMRFANAHSKFWSEYICLYRIDGDIHLWILLRIVLSLATSGLFFGPPTFKKMNWRHIYYES